MTQASRICFFIILGFAILLSVVQVNPETGHLGLRVQRGDESEISEVLDKTADYCDRIKYVALHFVCNERVQETTYFYDRKTIYKRTDRLSQPVPHTDLKLKKMEKHSWLFDYQMVKKGEEKQEKRIMLEENKKKVEAKEVKDRDLRFSSKFLVYGPVGFLSKYWQDFFTYRIEGREKVGLLDSIVISAVPNGTSDENNNTGKIWINEKDFSVLKIEWDPKSIAEYSEEIESSVGELKRGLKWTVYYAVVKNGVRFPSKQVVEEVLITPLGKNHPKYSAEVVYEQYKFFIVETEIKY